jgi:Ni/Co efflux regulator RcnB
MQRASQGQKHTPPAHTKETIVKTVIGATIALTLLASTAAVAQRDGRDHQSQTSDPRENNGGRLSPQGFDDPNSDRPHWSRGDRLPEQYRQDRYVVSDWRSHNLRTPPRGYRWVRNDNGQYLLAAIVSGVIADIVSQNQYRNEYQWSRGERLSGGYMDRRYVVSDWRRNHLRRPGRGYRWVHVNNQYLLAAIASGVIVDIVIDER